MKFAESTVVSVMKTKQELEALVTKAGATHFGALNTDAGTTVAFIFKERRILFDLKLPSVETFSKKKNRSGWMETCTKEDQLKRWEQACRTGWRALFLAIKAKLVTIDSGIETVDEAFLAHIVVPTDDGRTTRFGNIAIKAIADAYTNKGTPRLMLGSGA